MATFPAFAKNVLSIQRLKVITLATACYGLFLEVFPFLFPGRLTISTQEIILYLKLVNFSYLRFRWFRYYDFDRGIELNYLNVLFYILLLVGAVLYWKKQDNEIRLIRFCYAILFMVSLIYGFNLSVNLITHTPATMSQAGIFAWSVVRVAAVLFMSWLALNMLTETRTIDITIKNESELFVRATRWHRFFHFVVDTTLAAMLFLPTIQYYGGDFLQKLERGLGERPMLFVVLFVARMIYYPLFETLFGATPAKMFSESRVLTKRGDAITLDTSLYRTLSRFVPFEPFSFFGDSGWHDRWTDTVVVKEVRRGVKGSRYLLIVPVIAVVGVLWYVGGEFYDDYRSRVASRESHNEKVATLEAALNRLSTNSLVELKTSSYRTVYLKLEDIEGDQVYCSVFSPSEHMHAYLAGEYYKRNQYSLNKVMVSRTELRLSYQKEYDKALGAKRKSLLDDDEAYEIEAIFDLDLPLIRNRGTGSQGQNELSIAVENCGWGGVIKEITTTNGKFTFVAEGELPYTIKPSDRQSLYCSDFSFYCLDYERGEPYAFEFVVTDNAGNDHRYEVSGTDMRRAVRLVTE